MHVSATPSFKRHDLYTVGIIGTGKSLVSAGWQIAEQLCRRDALIEAFFLVNRTPQSAYALKEYIELVAPQTKMPVPPRVRVGTLDKLLEYEPTVTVIALEAFPPEKVRAHTAGTATSWRDLARESVVRRETFFAYNAPAIKEIAAACARKKGYGGNFLVYTNPVDVLTYLFLRESALDPSQVAGFNEGDSARFCRVLLAAAQEGQPLVELRDIGAFVLGPHNELVVPVFSQATIGGYGLLSFVGRSPLFRLEKLHEKTVGEAQRWFELLGSTSPELAWTCARVIDAWAQRDAQYQPTLSAYGNGMCIGQRVSLTAGLKPVSVVLDRSEQEQLDEAKHILYAQCSRL